MSLILCLFRSAFCRGSYRPYHISPPWPQPKVPSQPPCPLTAKKGNNHNVHAGGASRDPAALLQAVELAAARAVRLALHEVVIVFAAAGADEVGRRQQGRGAGADLLDLGDVVGERGRVDLLLLVESVRISGD